MQKAKRYVPAAQVRARYGDITDMTLWRWIRFHNFPEPLYINRRRYWTEEQLDAHDARLEAIGAEPQAA